MGLRGNHCVENEAREVSKWWIFVRAKVMTNCRNICSTRGLHNHSGIIAGHFRGLLRKFHNSLAFMSISNTHEFPVRKWCTTCPTFVLDRLSLYIKLCFQVDQSFTSLFAGDMIGVVPPARSFGSRCDFYIISQRFFETEQLILSKIISGTVFVCDWQNSFRSPTLHIYIYR